MRWYAVAGPAYLAALLGPIASLAVSVHSWPGKGTRFDLYFPALSAPSARTDADAQIDRWADEGGAIAPPVALEAAP